MIIHILIYDTLCIYYDLDISLYVTNKQVFHIFMLRPVKLIDIMGKNCYNEFILIGILL